MKIVPSKVDFHFIICTNARENKKDCASKGSIQLLEELKAWAKTQKFSKKIRINKSGCLDRCEEGAVCAAYPTNEWVVNASATDLDAIKKFIEERAR